MEHPYKIVFPRRHVVECLKSALAATAMLFSVACTGSPQPVKLLDGESLDGWSIHSRVGDLRNYRISDGVVTASSPQGADTFLCSPKTYRNFRLELEFKLEEKDGIYMNSGIQLRSTIQHEGGREVVTGWQCEIDPSPRAWTAGIYEEGLGRGWLEPRANAGQEGKFAGGKSFRHGDWNHLRILCEGHRVRTWLNGQAAADLTDPQGSLEGFIALQAHNGPPGMAYHFRNIRITELP